MNLQSSATEGTLVENGVLTVHFNQFEDSLYQQQKN